MLVDIVNSGWVPIYNLNLTEDVPGYIDAPGIALSYPWTHSGTMVAAFELEPPDTATSLRGDTVTDGPFIEAKEVIAGFYVIEAPDLDAALQVARQNPILRQGGGLEVRPVADSTLAAQ
jgi:hypothetical protein